MTTDREDTSSLAAKAALLHITGDSETEQKESKEKVEAADASKKDVNSVPDVPDYPSCDYCGDEFAGKLFCSQCRCAYYCSKECQKKHWKAPNGHKAKCSKMEEICKTKAQSFIDACNEFGADVFCTFIDKRDMLRPLYSFKDLIIEFKGLGDNGPYRKALDLGLNNCLYQLFMFERSHVKQRFELGLYVSIVYNVHCFLFRGKRNAPGNTFSCIDGYRVKQYVRCHKEAFEIWFRASLIVIEMFQTQGMDAVKSNDLDVFWEIQKVAYGISCSWMHVFTNKKAAKAILLGSSKEVDDTANERAKWIITQVKAILNNFTSIETPDNNVVEGQTNIFIALMQLRIEEFGIDIGDFVQLLEVKGGKKNRYEYLAIPLAEATIKKGRPLDTNENNQITQQYLVMCRKSHLGEYY
ncbi:hypothetical protein CTEN210_06486 [Chaetoceros tenuissimus]|uniref:MYND-type domain-containing protein n=1 Tax=Chaetoceros tenuissimus TaxID=426638 RepID=A0AAD3CSF9_9STRA|nr:hypothetical protein CTEN210_06486 [Chaetoceros tenuissimus]